jgi:hypothetical protein
MSEKCPEAVIRERPSIINSGDVQTHANLIFNGNGEFYLRTRFAFRVLRTIKTSPPSVKFATCIIPSLSKSLDRFEDLPGTELVDIVLTQLRQLEATFTAVATNI